MLYKYLFLKIYRFSKEYVKPLFGNNDGLAWSIICLLEFLNILAAAKALGVGSGRFVYLIVIVTIMYLNYRYFLQDDRWFDIENDPRWVHFERGARKSIGSSIVILYILLSLLSIVISI
jgi:hypothetical protein